MEVSVACKTIAAPSVPRMGCGVQPHGAVLAARVSSKTSTIRRSRRRTRRRLLVGGDSGDDETFLYYLGPGGFGPTDGGGFGFNGGKGGGGWNSGWFGGHGWDDPSLPPPWISGFAVNFFHEVISWIALSNCLHFAFKKVMRTVA